MLMLVLAPTEIRCTRITDPATVVIPILPQAAGSVEGLRQGMIDLADASKVNVRVADTLSFVTFPGKDSKCVLILKSIGCHD